jgi:hypothetical protein
MGFRLPALFLVPFQITRLIPLEPLEKPFLRPLQLYIYLLWRHTVEVFHYGALPDLLFHALNLLRCDPKRLSCKTDHRVTDVLTQKTALRVTYVLTYPGNRCIDSSHLTTKRRGSP